MILLKNVVHQALRVALNDELWQVVDYIRGVAIIVEAINDAFGGADAMVELAPGNQPGILICKLTHRVAPLPGRVCG